MKRDEPRLTLGYVRVSTDGQELSVDSQTTRIQANAESRGVTIDEMVIDRESAKDLNRTGIESVIQRVKLGRVASVIIWKLDRLTRSVRDLSQLLEMFDKKDVALVSLNETLDTSTATGRMMVKITTLFSEWERETIGERTSTVLEYKRSKGERLGNVPYGFRADLNTRGEDGKTINAALLEPEPGEQSTITRMKGLRMAGLSLQAIANTLNGDGFRTRRGTDWRPQYVDSILKQDVRQL